jgi:hypothetical protein
LVWGQVVHNFESVRSKIKKGRLKLVMTCSASSYQNMFGIEKLNKIFLKSKDLKSKNRAIGYDYFFCIHNARLLYKFYGCKNYFRISAMFENCISPMKHKICANP